MSDTCQEPHPERPEIACDKNPHPYGTHMNRDTGIFWEGLVMPSTKKRGASRVMKVVHAVEEAGTARRTGPPTTGEELRNEAIRRVDASTPEAFRAEARTVLRQVASEMGELTAEDVMDRLTTETHDNRAMGAIMLWGVKEGLIAKSDPEKFVQSRYPRRHKMDVRVWRSLVHG